LFNCCNNSNKESGLLCCCLFLLTQRIINYNSVEAEGQTFVLIINIKTPIA
jgi:hypothetical protein